MRSVSVFALLGVLAATVSAKPLASVPKFDGKFKWVKIGVLPPASVASLAKANSFAIEVTFTHAVTVDKDKGGNAWLSFIVADQGGDWKWRQTTGNGVVPMSGNTIKPGKYTILVPVGGIPREVLKGKQQSISIGPASSGLSGTAAFTIDAIRGK